MENIDDDMLAASLLHEYTHGTQWDVLRVFITQTFLALNPMRNWLLPSFQLWRKSNEAQCDQKAIQLGANPLALAESIIFCAKSPIPSSPVALYSPELVALRLRVELLMAPSSVAQQGIQKSYGYPLFLGCMLIVFLSAHLNAQNPLDIFHYEIEHYFQSYFQN